MIWKWKKNKEWRKRGYIICIPYELLSFYFILREIVSNQCSFVYYCTTSPWSGNEWWEAALCLCCRWWMNRGESPLFSSPCQCTSFDLVVCVLWVILFMANVKLNAVLWCNDILLPFIKYCAPHILCYCFLSISKYAVICFKLIIIKQNLNFNIESLSCR